MKPVDVVFRPRAGYWGFCIFLTLVIALNSLFWFFDPTPVIVKILGAMAILLWIGFLVGLARSRVELHADSVEIYGTPYQTPRVQPWLYHVLILFVLADVAILFLGTPPLFIRRIHFGLRLGWALLYFIGVLQAIESGRRSVKYADIAAPPWEEKWGVAKLVLFASVDGRSTPFMFPPWLAAEDRQELSGRIAARRRMALGLHEAHEIPLEPQPERQPEPQSETPAAPAPAAAEP